MHLKTNQFLINIVANLFSLFFIADGFVIGVGLVVYLLVMTCKFLAEKCSRSTRRHNQRSAGSVQLTKLLATIPIKTFKSGDPYGTCTICTEDYAEGDKLRVLHCSHGNNRFYPLFLLRYLLIRFTLLF